MNASVETIISRNRVAYCLECGKCSAACPITRWEKGYYASPRLLVEHAIEGGVKAVFQDPLLWSCLTCKRCSELCFGDVSFAEFVCELRALARKDGFKGDCSHGETIQTWARMMTDSQLSQDRLGWLGPELKVAEASETLLFTGCLPYYDILFARYEIEGVKIAQAAVKILNHLGIAPRLMADERCCGHDQLWEGDIETFRRLATLNLEQLKATGARQIVTTCPECARTLKLDYPLHVGEHHMQVFHMTEFLAQPDMRAKLDLQTQKNGRRATYQDPCRLGRHLNTYNEPRSLLTSLGIDLLEMERSQKAALCCGTSCWTACGQVSKNIQVERLMEARATGTDLLVTACIKCQIHFKCALMDPLVKKDLDLEIRDLTTLLAEHLKGK